MTHADHPAADRRWLAATFPFVRQNLPPPPCRVMDIGCGALGGFVPALRAEGYDAQGIDPDAPGGPHFHQVEFEQYDGSTPANAIVASTSLHHVSDLDTVVDRIAHHLAPDGVLLVIEWAWESFDEATAQWCFARLENEPGWLQRHRDDWLASGDTWDTYLHGWAAREHLHSGQEILRALTARLDTQWLARGPYFFPDLAGITEADEKIAIDAGHIQANGIRFVGAAR